MLQIINLLLKLLDLVLLVLLEICQHLLKHEDLCLMVISLLNEVINLCLHGLLTFLVCLKPSLHLEDVSTVVIAINGTCRGIFASVRVSGVS